MPDNEDLEANSSTTSVQADPFLLRGGIKTDAELAEFRRRKQGKKLANYHLRQNNVGFLPLLIPFDEWLSICLPS